MRVVIPATSIVQVKGKANVSTAAVQLNLNGKSGKRLLLFFDGANPAAASVGLNGTAAVVPTVAATMDANGIGVRPLAGDCLEFVSTTLPITDARVICAAAQDVYYTLLDA